MTLSRGVAIDIVRVDYEMCFPIEDLYEGRIDQEKPAGKVFAVAEPKEKYGAPKKK